MAKSSFRVPLPTDPSESIALLKKVKVEHDSLGASSPLAGMKWTSIASALAAADQQDGLSDTLRKDAEKATEARDAQMPIVVQALRSARDVLIGLNPTNPRVLGDYSFNVDDTPAATPAAKPKPAKP